MSLSNAFQTVSTQSPVATAPIKLGGRVIFKALSARERFRVRTDLNRLYKEVSKDISHDEFLNVFKNLQASGAGKLIIGRKGRPNRFAWKYNLKEVAEVALSGGSFAELNPLIPERATKKVRKVRQTRTKAIAAAGPSVLPMERVTARPVTSTSNVMITLNIELPADTNMSEVQALLDLAKGLRK